MAAAAEEEEEEESVAASDNALVAAVAKENWALEEMVASFVDFRGCCVVVR